MPLLALPVSWHLNLKEIKGDPQMTEISPSYLWLHTDLPEEAYFRLREGGFWRIGEPLNFTAGFNQSVRVASYKLVRPIVPGQKIFTVMGQWEGDPDWQLVGLLEYQG